ncbi:MAG: hypothetical protein ACO1OO_07515 [Flavisolibacter sp.]
MKRTLTDILKNFRQTPPPAAWEKIATALDERPLVGKLQNFHAEPPEHNWQAIAAALDSGSEEKPTGVVRKMNRWWAAAAVLLLLAVSAYLLQNREPSTDLAKTETKPVPVQTTPPENTNSQQQRDLSQNEQGTAGATTQASRVPAQGFDYSETAATRPERSINARSQQTPVYASAISRRPSLAPIENEEDFTAAVTAVDKTIARLDYSDAAEYMVYGAEDGSYTRVAKKIFPLLQCATWSSACKEQLQQLQSRISSASLSTGFAGFLDILSQLQENH